MEDARDSLETELHALAGVVESDVCTHHPGSVRQGVVGEHGQ